MKKVALILGLLAIVAAGALYMSRTWKGPKDKVEWVEWKANGSPGWIEWKLKGASD